ncbi:uncharacterized protein LOC110180148 isoform X2 [Drosophila serrata]|uniref:uncharacterized protein LOC110180148 isoform X2 n=1 Tax=Drosophila serrata TaxID=7274 RepID=UPI000A1D1A1E|nr:uncharacterized protein LOC110180148 isoform X2 [Drosophila serrata]
MTTTPPLPLKPLLSKRETLCRQNVRCSQTASLVFSVFERSALCLLHLKFALLAGLPVLQTKTKPSRSPAVELPVSISHKARVPSFLQSRY